MELGILRNKEKITKFRRNIFRQKRFLSTKFRKFRMYKIYFHDISFVESLSGIYELLVQVMYNLYIQCIFRVTQTKLSVSYVI